MKTDQQAQPRSQSELEAIIRNGKFGSQSEANSYLQRHGLTAQMPDDNTAEIYDGHDTTNRIATVHFQGIGKSQRQISGIDY